MVVREPDPPELGVQISEAVRDGVVLIACRHPQTQSHGYWRSYVSGGDARSGLYAWSSSIYTLWSYPVRDLVSWALWQ